MKRIFLTAGLALGIAVATAGLSLQPARADNVSVVVNGQVVGFDQPPIERAGRVFVPLRGVFERLGAGVVYSNGLINATGNGRNISLRIGSTQAVINGQTQYVDVAPFLVGSRTLVPLRFVAQALGAAVDWNQGSRTVTITGGNGSNGGNGGGSYTPPSNASFNLTNVRPTGTAQTLSPNLHAGFSEPVQRDSVRVRIDGVDVTNDVYANSNGFNVTPRQPLSAGSHSVRVTGTTEAGANFATGWTFRTSGMEANNYFRNIQPGSNSNPGPQFTITGMTAPNSHIHVVANSSASLGGIFQIGTGTYQTDVTADANGRFQIPLSASGGRLEVILESTSPGGSSIQRTLVYNT
ncbi:MAG: copper amine oxidase N-terminal domain-containing protein [Candidatus Eremiobacteraeota bacterium]|nr:copper amine oxidase N-terminal domain-containing protein [Candidatus Eremiobacteraeota bacterium]